ncbi:aldehyde dehydrogenase family protein [Geodermatophilus sp. DF01-2]|nr:aldehyde dehydrogenase family protein [Geodermatophilus sp. DF01_2]
MGAAGLRGQAARGESRMLIDGELVESSSGVRFRNVNPATEEVVGEVADGTAEELDRAIAAARRAQDESSWARDGAFRRHCMEQFVDAMARNLDELRLAMVTELGCPVRLATGVQVDPVVDKVRFMAGLADGWQEATELPEVSAGPMRTLRQIQRTPIGVVGAITPWNIPLDIALAKVTGALAAGNTLVLKPAPDTPWTTALIGRLFAEETDIPAGVLNVVHSSDHALGARLTADPRVDAISFTGSTATGRKVMAAAAEGLKRVHLELGGKSPSVVLDDANLEQVVPLAAALGCFNAGQSCILPSRLLVPVGRLNECLELAAFGMSSVPVGDPFDENVFMGPLVSVAHRDRVLAALASGLAEGGRVVVGGGVHPDFDRGYYVQPTLVADAPEHGSLIQEETFGPIVVVQAYEDLDDAVRVANGTPFGLAGYVWSEDEDRARDVAGRIRAGMIGINGGQFTGGDMPFGGVGASGLGREWGVAGLDEFLEIKTIAAARFS